MTSNGSPGQPAAGDGIPSPAVHQSEHKRTPSVISSRMTDLANHEENDSNAGQPQQAKQLPDSAAVSGSSKEQRNTSKGRTGPSTQKKSRTSGLGPPRADAGSSQGASKSRARSSHVPSLTSNAFFRPLSSQKLQAQRGGSRPVTMTQQPPLPTEENLDDNATDFGPDVVRQGAVSPVAQFQPRTSDDNMRPPPSRDTMGTEHETYGRVTANTSPTQGHAPTGSIPDSVRPLHKPEQGRANNLSVNVGKSHRELTSIPSPIKSPKSFRSSFLMPGKGDRDPSRNRSTEGAEKLASEASSPHAQAFDASGRPRQPARQMQQKNLGRVHEYFDGNTRFLLGGRWQNTRQTPINIATGVFAVVPCLLFLIFEAPWLWHNVSPAIPITVAYLSYICVSSFVHASVSDPGILPRNLHRFPEMDNEHDPLRVGPPTNDWTMIKSADRRTAAMEVPVKHCRTCNIWRPPRAHHCRLCDNCIEGHDHHCVWLNNCVGKRNYRYFFTFVTSGTLLSFYLIGTSLLQLLKYAHNEDTSFVGAMKHFPVPFALLILAVLTLCYPAALMGYHLFLMARGETTREHVNSHKFVKEERYRPFSQHNVLKNFFTVLCHPRPPTYYRFKSKYNQGDQRLGEHRSHRQKQDSADMEMHNVRPAAGFQGPVSLRGETQS